MSAAKRCIKLNFGCLIQIMYTFIKKVDGGILEDAIHTYSTSSNNTHLKFYPILFIEELGK